MRKINDFSGTDSHAAKLEALCALFSRATDQNTRNFVKELLVKRKRIGIGKESYFKVLRKITTNLSPEDITSLESTFRDKIDGRLDLFFPLKPMLSSTHASVNEFLESKSAQKAEEFVAEPKLDGERIQVLSKDSLHERVRKRAVFQSRNAKLNSAIPISHR